MERDLRDLRELLQAAFGEPPHQVTAASVRRRVRRRRAVEAVAGTTAVAAVIFAAIPALNGILGSHGHSATARASRAIAYVANASGVTPIRTATNTALPPIKAGDNCDVIAITPDGKTAYVANYVY